MPRKTRGKRPHGRDHHRGVGASMRPRPDAAENFETPPAGAPGRGASMRPRPDAAENIRGGDGRRRGLIASMRPRPDAAENTSPFDGPGRGAPGFNEAAARCRGKRVRSAWLGGGSAPLQ